MDKQEMSGSVVEFQRDKNDPTIIKIRVQFWTWNGESYRGEMLIPFKVNPAVTDEELDKYLYRGKEIIVNIQTKENLQS